MTNEEALKNIRKLSELYTLFDGDIFSATCNIAISALEKQIPKKPDYIREHDVTYFDWRCPHCKREFVNSTYGIAHCVDCGQAIDWTEEGELK